MNTDIEHHRLKMAQVRLVESGVEIVDSNTPVLGECPHCKQPSNTIARRRLNTAYCDDESNWLVSCGDCYQETVEHYKDLWATLYG